MLHFNKEKSRELIRPGKLSYKIIHFFPVLAAKEMDYRVYNIEGQIEESYQEVMAIIEKEKEKRGIV